MRGKPLSVDSKQILVNTRILADRWAVNTKTVLRVCRVHQVQEIRLQTRGRVFFMRDAVEALEAELFNWTA